MSDDLVERVARLYEDKWGVTDHGLARAAIALALEEAAGEAECVVAYGESQAVMRENIATAIRAMIPQENK